MSRHVMLTGRSSGSCSNGRVRVRNDGSDGATMVDQEIAVNTVKVNAVTKELSTRPILRHLRVPPLGSGDGTYRESDITAAYSCQGPVVDLFYTSLRSGAPAEQFPLDQRRSRGAGPPRLTLDP